MKALVTGATKGIGFAVTRSLLEEGCTVFAVGRELSRLQSLPAAKGKLIPYQADLMTCNLSALVSEADRAMGGISVLINNAGTSLSKKLEETEEAEWEAVMKLNAKIPFFLSKEAIPHLRKHTRSFIINIASVVATKGYELQSAYAASKHALLGFSKSAAKELQTDGIRVHVISPGGVATEMVTSMRPDIDTSELIAPEEIAEIVIFLLRQKGNAAIDEIQVRRETKTPFI